MSRPAILALSPSQLPHAHETSRSRMKDTSCRRAIPATVFVSCLTLSVLLVAAGVSSASETVAPRDVAPPHRWQEHDLAGFTKVLCSGVFVSGRDSAEYLRNSGNLFLDDEERAGITSIAIDRARRLVRVSYGDTLAKRARFFGSQGCVLLPDRGIRPRFRPVAVRSELPSAETTFWPMGDREPEEPHPPHDAAKLREAVETVFSHPEDRTAAFLVLHRGRILAERYGAGAHGAMPLESWSMGKSLGALLVGVAIELGWLGLDDPAPVSAWSDPGDPRRTITVADLLRMSSGLRFRSHHDPDYSPETEYPDHFYVYTGAIDALAWSEGKPLEFEPGSTGRYRNCDPLVLMGILKRLAGEHGEEYLAFPQRRLFDRIGIREMFLETDPYGNFLITGFDFGTARNWARLGLLCLQDGVWQGERVLPEGFVEFVRTPAPAWDEPVYGGLFWLNRTGTWALPADAYSMAGAGGQFTFVVPSRDLVLVRLGHTKGDSRAMRDRLRRAQQLILSALPE